MRRRKASKKEHYITSKSYASQLDKGGQSSDLLEVILEEYLSFHTIRVMNSNRQSLKGFTFVFIEIPKYQIHENAQGIDEWIDLFKFAQIVKLLRHLIL